MRQVQVRDAVTMAVPGIGAVAVVVRPVAVLPVMVVGVVGVRAWRGVTAGPKDPVGVRHSHRLGVVVVLVDVLRCDKLKQHHQPQNQGQKHESPAHPAGGRTGVFVVGKGSVQGKLLMGSA